jgi:ribosomal protein L18E
MAHAFSAGARAAIEKAGGTVVLLTVEKPVVDEKKPE